MQKSSTFDYTNLTILGFGHFGTDDENSSYRNVWLFLVLELFGRV